MIAETTHLLHTTAPSLAPYTSHALTIVAAADTGNIFDSLFGIGDDFKTAVLKRGIGIIVAGAVLGGVCWALGIQIGRAFFTRAVIALVLVFFALGPLVGYLQSHMPATP